MTKIKIDDTYMDDIVTYRGPEQWADLTCKNIKPMYEISTYGRIRNKKKDTLLKPRKNENGYYTISLMTFPNNKAKTFKVHRLVALTFIEQPIDYNSEKYTVNHINGSKSDNSTLNLEWLTIQDNIKHARDHMLWFNKTVYKDSVVESVCELLQENKSYKEIIKEIKDRHNVNINRHFIYDVKVQRSHEDISNKYFTKDGSTTIENEKPRIDIIVTFS